MEEKDPQSTPASEESTPEIQTDSPRLYLGRFTAGTWHGGVLGLALGYILIGVLGLLDSKFSFGIRGILQNPAFKYGLMLVLMYGLGKLGGILEKRRDSQE